MCGSLTGKSDGNPAMLAVDHQTSLVPEPQVVQASATYHFPIAKSTST
jgi:hypothetical protein